MAAKKHGNSFLEASRSRLFYGVPLHTWPKFNLQKLIEIAGFPLTFGVFQDYYSRQPEFQQGGSNIQVIGAVSTSIYFLSAPIMSPLVKKYHRFQRHMVVLGAALCVLAVLAASFVSSVSGLIITQGVMYGIGFSTLYTPVLRMLDEWFLKRRGLAYGLFYAGGGLSGAGLPLVLEALLSKYGFRTTLRAVAVAQFLLVGPVLFLIKGRLPTSSSSSLRPVDWGFFSQPLFWCFALSNFMQGIGYYIPSLFLPTFASNLGLSGTMGAILLSTNNLATVVGQVSFGYLSDRINNVLILVFASSFMSSIAAFTIWGLAKSMGTLMAFSLMYGWFAGAFPVLWQKFGSVLSHDPQPILSLMAFGKGLGNIAIAPISAGLVTQSISPGYGLGKFEPLILFLGSSMLCSSLGILGWPLRQRAPPN